MARCKAGCESLMTIDELIRAHWGETVVLQGESPEAYAIRREEDRIWTACLIEGWDQAPLVVIEAFYRRTEGGVS